MPWYEVSQNNSQGVFDKSKGNYLFIKAPDSQSADQALTKYIKDVDEYPYCPCCGERWPYEIDDSDIITQEYMMKHYDRNIGKWFENDVKFMSSEDGKILNKPEASHLFT